MILLDSIDTFILKLVETNIDEHLSQGHANPGNNGPYCFKDTPVRNTAHWLIIYSYLWNFRKDERYQQVAKKFADYLMQMQKCSTSGAIECIHESDFDHINGLIGQAWVIEALVYAYEVFDCYEYLKIATAIFKSQKFDDDARLWKRVELDGSVVDFDYTMNHQVWFAAAGMMLLKHSEDARIRSEVELFLTGVDEQYFAIYENGLIKHYGSLKNPRKYSKGFYVKRALKNLCVPLRKKNPNRFDSKAQEKGYHLFELYGFAIIGYYRPEYSLFHNPKFKKALCYGSNILELNRIFNIGRVLGGNSDGKTCMNKFAYGYNSPAFEYPYIQMIFKGHCDENTAIDLLDIQMKLTYSHHTGMLSENNYDCETLTARVYEYIRFCNLLRKERE